MKTAMKKLLSFVLVAVLLVSAVPFQASATAELIVPINKPDTSENESNPPDGGITPYAADPDATWQIIVTDGTTTKTIAQNQTKSVIDRQEAALKDDPKGEGAKLINGVIAIPEGKEIDTVTTNKDAAAKTLTVTVTFKEKQAKTLTIHVTAKAQNDTGLIDEGDATVTEGETLTWAELANRADLNITGKIASVQDGNGKSLNSNGVNEYTFKNDMSIVMYISGQDGSAGGGGSSDPTTYALTIIDKLKGTNETRKATRGQTYSEFVGERAEAGYDFLGWYSGNTKINLKDPILSDITIEALWSNAKKYTITFMDERDSNPTVVKAYQMSYGARFGDVFGEKLEKVPTPSERKGYVFMGWKINGKKITADTLYEWQGDVTAYASWALESDTPGVPVGGGTTTTKGKVYLEIYTNGDTRELVKRVNITDYADDNKITRKEVEKVVKKYLAAKSGYSLKMIGLFDEESWWWYTRDEETNGEDTIVVNRDGDDYVYVMVKNVKTAKKDETNPKTGDPMVTTMTIMTVSATTLALVYFFNKKRMFVK